MKLFQPIQSFLNSALSETGTVSSKRVIAFAFMAAMVYIEVYCCHTHFTANLMEFIFIVDAILIALMTGVATVKDIIALKNGSNEQTKPASEPTQPTTDEAAK